MCQFLRRLCLQLALLGLCGHVVDVALHVYQIVVPVEVAPLQAQRFPAPQTRIVKHSQQQAVLVGFYGLEDALGFKRRQRPALLLFVGLGANQPDCRIALNDAVGKCASECLGAGSRWTPCCLSTPTIAIWCARTTACFI